jgi:SAM-dependent methyltransferase
MFREWRILDAGYGTGHHLAKIAEALPPPVVGIGLDISRDAARQAARRWRMLAFAVADLWTEWPVRDTAVDLVISVFAPKNFGRQRECCAQEVGLRWCIRARIIWSSLTIASG